MCILHIYNRANNLNSRLGQRDDLLALISPDQVETMVYTEENWPRRYQSDCIIRMKYRAQQMVATTKRFKDLGKNRRGCLYPTEKRLEHFQTYRKSNCMLECAWKRAEKKCQCTPWYLFRNQTRLCDLYGMGCYRVIVSDIMSGGSNADCHDQCPGDCEMVIYTVQPETKDLSNPNFNGYCDAERTKIEEIRSRNGNSSLYEAPVFAKPSE